MDKLIHFIAGIIFNFYYSRWKRKFHPQVFNNVFDSVKKAVIIMPHDNQGIPAGLTLMQFLMGKNVDVTLLIHNKFHSALPVTLKCKKEEFYDSEINFFGIPKPDLLNRLKMIESDIIIDMDGSNNFTSAMMTLAIHAKNKIGIKKPETAKVYNIAFGLSGNSLVESYQNYVNLLVTF
jgi:hypothetical protein